MSQLDGTWLGGMTLASWQLPVKATTQHSHMEQQWRGGP